MYRLLLPGVKHTQPSKTILFPCCGFSSIVGSPSFQATKHICYLNAHQELLNKTHMYAPRTELTPAKCVNYIKGKICSKITV